MRRLADPYQRRRAIVDLHAEGWSNTAISAYLQTPRHRVYEVLKRSAIVSDGGGIFYCNQAMDVYASLSIRKERIEPRQA